MTFPLQRSRDAVRPAIWGSFVLLLVAMLAVGAVAADSVVSMIALVPALGLLGLAVQHHRRGPQVLWVAEDRVGVGPRSSPQRRLSLALTDLVEVVIDADGERWHGEDLRFPATGSAGEQRHLWSSWQRHQLTVVVDGVAPNVLLRTGECEGMAVAVQDAEALARCLAGRAPLRVVEQRQVSSEPPVLIGHEAGPVASARAATVAPWASVLLPLAALWAIPDPTTSIVVALLLAWLPGLALLRARSRSKAELGT